MIADGTAHASSQDSQDLWTYDLVLQIVITMTFFLINDYRLTNYCCRFYVAFTTATTATDTDTAAATATATT